MEDVLKEPVQLSKGINLKELFTSQTEFHIDTDFKKKRPDSFLNMNNDLMLDTDDEDDSDTEDILKNIETSTEQMLLSSPEYHSFKDLAAKMIDCVPTGDVKMLIIEEGDGPLVPVDAEVTLHYAAYWEKAKIPFDSTLTMNSGMPMHIRLGTGSVLLGLEIGLTAVKGPKARFHLLLQPKVAWGEKGAPPRVKPEPVLFVIALYDVRDTQAGTREEALKYYNKALKLEPKNKEIGKALVDFERYVQDSSQKEKEMWQNAFKATQKKKTNVVYDVDEEFQNGVREMCQNLVVNEERAQFELPTGLTRNELDFLKALVTEFDELIVDEEGEGKRKRVTVVKL
ncbi:Peptidyl-prolyl cis-trans isomerase FKBP6 [Papilio xuthus]|uniref:peptidylprolyl isomerase n=1 Tax=Papilio xuthus TaxID=66420 RepID=A0A194QAL3_PAPXU|nr:Peptidyl-prolyl cis-trans isomerase FKBP6 [Papilio xuthus]